MYAKLIIFSIKNIMEHTRFGISAGHPGSPGDSVAIGSGSDHPSTRAGRRIACACTRQIPSNYYYYYYYYCYYYYYYHYYYYYCYYYF